MHRASIDPDAQGATTSPRTSTAEHAFEISARDGIYGLNRVLAVFALLGIAPGELQGRQDQDQDRVRIGVRFRADPRRAQLCYERLSGMACVESVSGAPASR
ncbi:MAG: hypothetical protein GC203_22540 [Phenylobacterium sp.]|uniref:hypothetical protein n=1 Tax=Phenylobacterium sp. TaxID=1871053 RepID=UPI0025D8E6C2|nr:hypothetical protein [Phenylobacterium sp.]MBI1200651.1 hypothetical protein [Phenylobacterium sp.]